MMEEKVLAAIGRHKMLSEGDSVIVALSGGADSVALFHFLLSRRGALGIRVAAAHFEHGLRGGESLRDRDFVRRLCEDAGVELYEGRGRMSEREKPRGLSVEAWARNLRYAYFDELAARQGAKVATAHTQGDNAETVLFHALRGAGPAGLAGIPPVRGAYVRPLLWVSRAEVEAYCLANGLAYMEDSTNADPAYTRNRLRHEALPLLEDIRAGSAAALARMAGDMGALDAWLAELALKTLAEAACDALALGLPAWAAAWAVEPLLAAPAPVRLKALALLAGRSADRRALAGAEAVLEGSLKGASMPGGVELSRWRGLLLAERPAGEAGADYAFGIENGEYRLPGGYMLRISTENAPIMFENGEKVHEKALTFVADCAKMMQYGGVLRPRRAGDRIAPAGRGVTKPLRKWMNEAGVPPPARACLPLIAAGGQVLWVWGHGFAQGLAPGPGTGARLVIETRLNREGTGRLWAET